MRRSKRAGKSPLRSALLPDAGERVAELCDADLCAFGCSLMYLAWTSGGRLVA